MRNHLKFSIKLAICMALITIPKVIKPNNMDMYFNHNSPINCQYCLLTCKVYSLCQLIAQISNLCTVSTQTEVPAYVSLI